MPNYQAHPVYVMHHANHPYLRWDLMTLFEIPKHIKRILSDPAHGYLRTHPRASAGLQWILDGTERLPEHEAECDEYTDWLHECGPAHAPCPPSAIERARAAGVADCFTVLGLSGRRLFDAVGLAFDGRSLQRRLWPLLREWDAGQMTRAPACPLRLTQSGSTGHSRAATCTPCPAGI